MNYIAFSLILLLALISTAWWMRFRAPRTLTYASDLLEDHRFFWNVLWWNPRQSQKVVAGKWGNRDVEISARMTTPLVDVLRLGQSLRFPQLTVAVIQHGEGPEMEAMLDESRSLRLRLFSERSGSMVVDVAASEIGGLAKSTANGALQDYFTQRRIELLERLLRGQPWKRFVRRTDRISLELPYCDHNVLSPGQTHSLVEQALRGLSELADEAT